MITRRDALRALSSLAALPLVRALSVDELLSAGDAAHARAMASAPRVLTRPQYEVVTLAAERIIPRTATPGATDAKVADFIDVMLADWYTPAERARFVTGVNELVNGGFARLSAPRQTATLEALDRDVATLRQSDPAHANEHWFAMLKFLTVWGFYTSRAGIVQELHEDLLPGRYDGNAAY